MTVLNNNDIENRFQSDCCIQQDTQHIYHVEQTVWKDSFNEILAVRHKVFMVEQHFSDKVLCDINDNDCFHIIVRDEQEQVVGSGRITEQGRIGRIAVLLSHRGNGLGNKILERLVEIAQQQAISKLSLNAELSERNMYNTHQFAVAGPVFMKQGIPHQMFTRKLA